MVKVKMVARAAIPDITHPETAGRMHRGNLTLACILALALALSACGEAEEDSAPAPVPVPEEETPEPVIEELPLVDLEADALPAEADIEQEPEPDMLAEMPVMPPQPVVPTLLTVTRVRALDKITARVIELDLPEDTEVRFGTLAIRARTCRSRPPEEPPETFAFLEIDDVMSNQEYQRVFAGWMMASSPALNALEHPVYDVWVIACSSSSAEASSASE
jgi:hypothetical protein